MIADVDVVNAATHWVEREAGGAGFVALNRAERLALNIELDIADAVFEPDSVEMRAQWVPRIKMLLGELQKGPAVLRLSYVADVESEQLVEQRLELLKSQIMSEWQELNCCYELVIEPEIFWRLGGPPVARREDDR